MSLNLEWKVNINGNEENNHLCEDPLISNGTIYDRKGEYVVE